jgi:hypothetical protein
VLGELGRPEQMWPAVAVARAAAEELRIAYAEVVLDGLAVPWQAMAGRFEECEAALEHLRTVGRRLTHSTAEELHVAAVLVLRLWQGRSLEMVPVLEQLDSQFYPFSASIAVYLWRAGEHDRARAVHAERGAPLDVDSDLAVIAWSHGAELALYVGDPGLAAATYELLAPLAGRSTCAGSALALGPVDSFLALAAAAAGERELAARHADDALRLCAAWGLPMVAEWLEQARAAYDF